ncbi:UNKNOWN [Stylonychia lemnae]|uniref:Uncharacterized protein n=1 Tax=Stylonychia lemnae TaxID=5949 RepID=A0A078AH49_STYLE|nr:UNKNOWN [Stylonychia lemnae]|eukprot:CDW81156.1 UNKNOWN [Stylonychia lemnae]
MKILQKLDKPIKQNIGKIKELYCYMYHPRVRKLIPCHLKIQNQNCKYLINEFERIKKHNPHANLDRKSITQKKQEFYEYVKINLYDGLISDQSAYNTLVKKYGCTDEKISSYNVLKFRSFDFERIFVFYREDFIGGIKDKIKDGEKNLEMLVKSLKALSKVLGTYDENLFGQMAEIKQLKRPEANMINFNEQKKQLNQQDKDKGSVVMIEKSASQAQALDQRAKISKQNLMLNRHYLQDIVVESVREEDRENIEGEKERYQSMKLDLRFTNQESSKQFKFQVDCKASDFWRNFDLNFHKVTAKPTDLNFLKIFLIEREFEENSARNQEDIDRLMRGFYQCKLRDRATKQFFTWVEKESKEKLKPQIALLENEIKKTYDEMGKIEDQYDAERDKAIKKDNKIQLQNAMKEYNQAKKEKEYIVASQQEQHRKMVFRKQTLKEMKIYSRQRLSCNKTQIQEMDQKDQQMKIRLEKEMDEFIHQKKIKLISKDNNDSIDPLMQLYELMTIQELDLKIRQVNYNKIKSRGQIKRGGKKTVKRKAKGGPRKNKKQSKSQPARLGQDEAAPELGRQRLSKFSVLLTKFRSQSHQNQKEESRIKFRNQGQVGQPSINKRGSRSNWDQSHRRYIKSIEKAKKDILDREVQIEKYKLQNVKESDEEDDGIDLEEQKYGYDEWDIEDPLIPEDQLTIHMKQKPKIELKLQIRNQYPEIEYDADDINKYQKKNYDEPSLIKKAFMQPKKKSKDPTPYSSINESKMQSQKSQGIKKQTLQLEHITQKGKNDTWDGSDNDEQIKDPHKSTMKTRDCQCETF